MPKIRISDIGLMNLKPADRHLDYWDTALPTFGVRVSPKGTKTFVIKMHNGRQSIGRYPVISLSDARTAAKRLLAEKTLGRLKPVGARSLNRRIAELREEHPAADEIAAIKEGSEDSS